MAEPSAIAESGVDTAAAGCPAEERSRADSYGLLAALLARPPEQGTLDVAAAIEGNDTAFGRALDALAGLARAADPALLQREYHDLFIGLGRGELLPYASYYLTGFLHEKPLARIRRSLQEVGITRTESVCEPEDHIASLCEAMQAMILGNFGPPVGLDRQKAFFEAHVAPWAGHFFTDLEGARHAEFYAPVGTLGRHLIDIERDAFRMEI